MLILLLFASNLFAESTPASATFALDVLIVVVRLNLDGYCCFIEVLLVVVEALLLNVVVGWPFKSRLFRLTYLTLECIYVKLNQSNNNKR